jgi:hypothetical protein
MRNLRYEVLRSYTCVFEGKPLWKREEEYSFLMISSKRMVFFFGSFSFILQVLTYPILEKGSFFTKKMKKPDLIEEEIFQLKLPTSGKKNWVIIRP